MHKKFNFIVVLALLVINSSCSNKKQDNSENAALIDTDNHQILEMAVLPPKW